MTLTKAEANRINGRKGGRPKGRRNNETLAKEEARKIYETMAREKLQPLFYAQLTAALGRVFVFRKEHHGTGASRRIEHVQLTEPHEIAEALDAIANEENGHSSDDGFCYVMAHPPGERALDSMLDRSIGKAAQKLEHTGADGTPLAITLVKYAKGAKSST